MILEARVKAGWIEAPEPQEDEAAAEEESAEDGDAVEEAPDAAGKQAG
jgi:hypothetical protein